MTFTILLLGGGGVLLLAGAELLVRGASRIAFASGISPLVVGLTVVAFGTSAPELAVSVSSALSGHGDVALGNVVGSNIFNVLFILGLTALLAPLVVQRRLVRLELPVTLVASVVVIAMALDGVIGRGEAIALLGGLLVYTWVLLRQSLRQGADASVEGPPPLSGGALVRNVLIALGGLALLVLGSRWFVGAAAEMAARLGVSELVVGLTVVAAGTSLPEVATSVVAVVRGQRDLAVGNVIGSNIFNLLGVLGAGALVAPDGIAVAQGALTFDLPIMLAATLATVPIFVSGWVVARWEGGLFLLWYVAYVGWLVVDATHHPGQDELGLALLGFALPFTVLLLLVTVLRSLRR